MTVENPIEVVATTPTDLKAGAILPPPEQPTTAIVSIEAATAANDDMLPSDAIVAISNDVLANGPSANDSPRSNTPRSSGSNDDAYLDRVNSATHSRKDDDLINSNDDDAESDVFQDAMDDLPATKKLHQRLSSYSPQIRESEEWLQIMQDWDRVMAEKRIQDAKLHLVEQENKRMRGQLVDLESAKSEVEKDTQEKLVMLEKENKELLAKTKDPAKEKQALKNQLEESEAEKELFKLMLEETEGEKKRLELKLAQFENEKEVWKRTREKALQLRNRLKLKAAQFALVSTTSTASLLGEAAEGLDGARPDKERKRLMDQVHSLESDRSRLAAMVKDTIGDSFFGDQGSSRYTVDISMLSHQELAGENKRLHGELQMSKVEYSLQQRRNEALEVTLHDVRVALANSEAHAESLEMKKYDLQDKLTASEGLLDRSRIESIRYQGLHKEVLEKNDKLDRELQVIKARFDAKDRVLITTQKQLSAAKADGGLLKTIRRELESVLFDYNIVVQHFMDIQVQAIGAKALANTLKRQCNDLQQQLTHYRSILLGIKSFNNNDPIKSPTVTTLRSEFRVLLEKVQEEHNKQVDKERGDKSKAQDWNRKLRMEKDYMKLELQNQIEKWRRVSIYWEDKWRKTANDLHEAVTSGTSSESLLQSKRRSLAISTSVGGSHSHEQPMTPSAMKQQILESKLRTASSSSLTSSGVNSSSPPKSRPQSTSFFLSSAQFSAASTGNSSSANSNVPSTATLAVGAITDLVSNMKPFLSRTLSQTSGGSSSLTSTGTGSAVLGGSLVGAVGMGPRGPTTPSSRLAAAQSLRTPIAAGLPSSVPGVSALSSSTPASTPLTTTPLSKTTIRSRNMATSAIGSARSQTLQSSGSGSGATEANKVAQSRANSSISETARSVDQALSESDQLKADIRRMLNR
ncbi:hypothetical protein BGW38_002527 [Lunasporangiospora selenospora]|uniref:Uncharacterized protein n=1 Tax=Lunasporangiospora selenospora TaxID=979761 RepID=A0A9P6FRY3_9FUNG|nr:hypothetical protein BGW38_002527 [Lunasporangiospora selenospora]